MRILVFLTLFLGSLGARADEVMLKSYFTSVRRHGVNTVYTHEGLDDRRVPRLSLWKTARPKFRNGKADEEVIYAVGIKDANGTIVNEELISFERYSSFKTALETAKQETLLVNWAFGCPVRMAMGPQNILLNLASECPENKNPAIEAGSSEEIK